MDELGCGKAQEEAMALSPRRARGNGAVEKNSVSGKCYRGAFPHLDLSVKTRLLCE